MASVLYPAKSVAALRSLIAVLTAVFLVYTGASFGQTGTGYQIVETLPHNADYFTQGLQIHRGVMYESGGRYGKSKVRKYLPENDDTLVEVPIADRYFAEGLTLFNDELFLLTWRENTLFVLDPEKLTTKRQLTYEGDGWGLAATDTQLVMSDGSETLYFRNPGNFSIEREITVHYKQHTVQRLNELEFANGFIWANIWRTPLIVKIQPDNGAVVAFYDFTALVKQHSNGNDERVLNGIAYDKKKDAFWITGKLWPKRYLVQLK